MAAPTITRRKYRTRGRRSVRRSVGFVPQASAPSREWLPIAGGRKRVVLPTGE